MAEEFVAAPAKTQAEIDEEEKTEAHRAWIFRHLGKDYMPWQPGMPLLQPWPWSKPAPAIPIAPPMPPAKRPDPKWAAQQAQRDLARDLWVESLIERAEALQLDSPDVQELKASELTAYLHRKKVRQAEIAAEEDRLFLKAEKMVADQAEMDMLMEEAAEESLLRLEARNAVAEEEYLRQAAEEARSRAIAEEAAMQARYQQEAREQLQAETAAAEEQAEAEVAAAAKLAETEAAAPLKQAEVEAAEVEKQRQTLIRPLEPKWEARIKAAMDSNNDRAVIVKTVNGTELSRKDFASLLPKRGETKASGWLNDEIVNAFFASIVAEKKEQTGWKKGMVPAYQALNTAWYTNYKNGGVAALKTWTRRLGIKGPKLLEAEKLYLPVTTGAHWMLLVVSPQAKTIEYLDSLPSSTRGRPFFRIAREFLAMELGAKAYVAADWTESAVHSSVQDNLDDCGAFACLNGLASAKGADFADVAAEKMQDGRRMIGAILINGGFHGDWKL